ncbi:MAG: hypothetical protein JEZ09_20140 [Salinivirgaceae bacterium]|nr:hypothetical protein [Salinivirgaceae bacterium]
MIFKTTSIIGLIIVGSIIFSSCSKESVQETSKQETRFTFDYELPSDLTQGITQENGLMLFESEKFLNKITLLLETENQNYVEAYFNSKQALSEDELDIQMELDNFNPFTVYEAFEKYHSFYSLRANLKSQEDDWMDSSSTDELDNNPSFYPLSDKCQNIANEEGEYMIGSTIYRVESDGLVYEIKNADYKALESIRCGNSNLDLKNTNPNVIIHREEVRSSANGTKADCKSYIRRTGTYNYADKKKMDCILDLDWDVTNSAAKAKAKCYKKVKRFGNWKWKRNWTSMGTSLCVKARDIDCEIKIQFGDHGLKCNSQSRNWAYFVTCHVYGAGVGFRVKPGEYGGVYKKSGYNDYSISW